MRTKKVLTSYGIPPQKRCDDKNNLNTRPKCINYPTKREEEPAYMMNLQKQQKIEKFTIEEYVIYIGNSIS